MRIWALVVTGMLAVAISDPASAARRGQQPSTAQMRSYEACESKASALGMPHGQAGHTEYVRECMGKRPRNSNNAASGN